MNNKTFKEKTLRVMWYKKNFGGEEKQEANLYIKDIPASATQKDLNDKFSPFGSILSCSLPLIQNTKTHRGFGYVQYEKPEEAKEAISALHESDWDGNKIVVNILIPQNKREAGHVIKNNLFVTGFTSNMTQENLSEIFSVHGEITSISIPDAEVSKGYVCFKTEDQAEKAKEALNNATPVGSFGTLSVAFHLKRTAETMKEQKNTTNLTRNLFVKGFQSETTIDDLKAFFGKFGEIESGVMGLNGRSAYICYATSEAASKAIYEGTLSNPFGRNFAVDYFVPKGMRQKQQKDIEQNIADKNVQMFMSGMFNLMQNMGQGGQMGNMQGMNRGGFGGGYSQRSRGGGRGYGRGRGSGYHNRGRGGYGHGGMQPEYGQQQAPKQAYPQQMPVTQVPLQAPVAQIEVPDIIGLTKDQLNGLGADDSSIRQAMGEKIYPVVQQQGYSGSDSGKITGMLIDMDRGSLAETLVSLETLVAKIKEAKELIDNQAKDLDGSQPAALE